MLSCVAIFTNSAALHEAARHCQNGNSQFLGYTLADRRSLNGWPRLQVSRDPLMLIVAIESVRREPTKDNQPYPLTEAVSEWFVVDTTPIKALFLGQEGLRKAKIFPIFTRREDSSNETAIAV